MIAYNHSTFTFDVHFNGSIFNPSFRTTEENTNVKLVVADTVRHMLASAFLQPSQTVI